MAFKGVLLEGFEVVVIVVTLGTTDRELGVSALAALAAVLIVSGLGAALSRQLSGVPENALKMFVGILLVSFGSFWSGEGLGVHWPGSDLAILVLVAVYGALAALLTRVASHMNRQLAESDAPVVMPVDASESSRLATALKAFGAFWLDFLVGDTPELLFGVLIVIGAEALVVHQHAPRAVVVGAVPVLAAALLFVSVARRARARR